MPTSHAASDSATVERLRTLLANRTDVQEKRMFGSLAFMVNDKMCICAGKGRLMCRVDPETANALLREDGVTSMVMKGRTMRGYLVVPYENVTTKARLEKWLRRCLEFNAEILKRER